MTLEVLKKKLIALDIVHFYEPLLKEIRYAIAMKPVANDEDKIAIGATKIGGHPDLPETIAWPYEPYKYVIEERKFIVLKKQIEVAAHRPMSFVAQINLSEVNAFDEEGLLPESGWLYFFYSCEQEGWGFDPADSDKFKVIYFDGVTSELKRLDFPVDLPDYSIYKASSVDLKKEISLPPPEHPIYEQIEEEDLDELMDVFYYKVVNNKMLGFSNPIQGEMELECELVTNGLYCGDASGYEDPKAHEFEKNKTDWRLLLQIDSNEENEMMWGDSGMVYYWIKELDLKNKAFEQSWFCFQCC